MLEYVFEVKHSLEIAFLFKLFLAPVKIRCAVRVVHVVYCFLRICQFINLAFFYLVLNIFPHVFEFCLPLAFGCAFVGNHNRDGIDFEIEPFKRIDVCIGLIDRQTIVDCLNVVENQLNDDRNHHILILNVHLALVANYASVGSLALNHWRENIEFGNFLGIFDVLNLVGNNLQHPEILVRYVLGNHVNQFADRDVVVVRSKSVVNIFWLSGDAVFHQHGNAAVVLVLGKQRVGRLGIVLQIFLNVFGKQILYLELILQNIVELHKLVVESCVDDSVGNRPNRNLVLLLIVIVCQSGHPSVEVHRVAHLLYCVQIFEVRCVDVWKLNGYLVALSVCFQDEHVVLKSES